MNSTQSYRMSLLSGAPSREKETALVVLHIEDSADDRELFQMAAGHAKLPIFWHAATSSKGAIAYLQGLLSGGAGNGSSVIWPDLVLLDIVMPIESGARVLEFVHSHASLRRLPVVVLTGCEDEEITEQAWRLGAQAVFQKPHNFEALVALVQSVYHTYATKKAATDQNGPLPCGLQEYSTRAQASIQPPPSTRSSW